MKTKPRTVQEIFNAVIDAGYYGMHRGKTDYMCMALSLSLTANKINYEECKRASLAIDNYLSYLADKTGHSYKSYGTLNTALWALERPADSLAKEKIYRNWAKRPRTKLKR